MLTVQRDIRLNEVVETFHRATKNRHRINLFVFMLEMKKQRWYFKLACKYIDYRIYGHNEDVLYSFIGDYKQTPETTNRILNSITTNSLAFFVACNRKLSRLLQMHPICTLIDVIQPYTVTNRKLHNDFVKLFYDHSNVYNNVCDYLEWLSKRQVLFR